MLSAVLCARCTMRMALVGAHILFYRSVRESGRYDSGRRAVHGTVNVVCVWRDSDCPTHGTTGGAALQRVWTGAHR